MQGKVLVSFNLDINSRAIEINSRGFLFFWDKLDLLGRTLLTSNGLSKDQVSRTVQYGYIFRLAGGG